MAGAKIPTRRKKKRGRSSSRPTSTFTLRHVRQSSGLSSSEAAARLGLSPASLRRRALSGRIPASIDDHGRYHFAETVIARRETARRRTKKKLLGSKKRSPTKKAPRQAPLVRKKRAPAAAAAPAASAERPGKKKLRRKASKLAKKSKHVSKKVAGKKAVKKRPGKRPERAPQPPRRRPPPPPPPPRGKKKRRAKKSKRPTRPPQPPPRVPLKPGWVEGKHGVPVPAPGYVEQPAYSAATPMPIDLAAKAVGESMRDYIMARFKWEREGTHLDFYGQKHSFRHTYGIAAWHEWFEWIVDEWDLEPYVFDRTALRDS